MKITTILPVSRLGYLNRVLESLKNQTYKTSSLIVIFDGSDEDYELVKNRVSATGYPFILCGKSNNLRPAFAITERREHIANIHNQIREILSRDSIPYTDDWIFSIEDDGVLPPDALERLVDASNRPDVGMVTGVELGRWGVPYVGAWQMDSTVNPTRAISMENKTGQTLLEEIDACGLYCALIRPELYMGHEFDAHNGLGPDVNLGLYIRNKGFKNYINWQVPVTHLNNDHGVEIEIPATADSRVVELLLQGTIWHQNKFPSGQVFPLTL